MSDIRIDLSGSDAESLKQLAKGDTLSLEAIIGTVTSNDGKVLTASVDEMTCCAEDGEEEGGDMAEDGKEDTKGEHTPIAVIAIKSK